MRQYPLPFKEFFVTDFFFCLVFSDDLRPKSINVFAGDLVAVRVIGVPARREMTVVLTLLM